MPQADVKTRSLPHRSSKEASLALVQYPADPAEAALPSRHAFLELRPQDGLASRFLKGLLRVHQILHRFLPTLTGRSLQPHSQGHPSGRAHCPHCTRHPDSRLQAKTRYVTFGEYAIYICPTLTQTPHDFDKFLLHI